MKNLIKGQTARVVVGIVGNIRCERLARIGEPYPKQVDDVAFLRILNYRRNSNNAVLQFAALLVKIPVALNVPSKNVVGLDFDRVDGQNGAVVVVANCINAEQSVAHLVHGQGAQKQIVVVDFGNAAFA